jgi:hypothetical protein
MNGIQITPKQLMSLKVSRNMYTVYWYWTEGSLQAAVATALSDRWYSGAQGQTHDNTKIS